MREEERSLYSTHRSGEPPEELVQLYAREEEAFLKEMYARGRERPALVRIGPEVGGWQEVEVLAQLGSTAEEEACSFYHKVRTGANQFEKPIKMVAAKYAAEEEELSQTCEAAVLQEKMEQVRLQHAESLGALQALNVGKRDVQRKKPQERLRKKKREARAGRKGRSSNGGSRAVSDSDAEAGGRRDGKGAQGSGKTTPGGLVDTKPVPPPPPPRGKAKLQKSEAIAALMELEDEDDDDDE